MGYSAPQLRVAAFAFGLFWQSVKAPGFVFFASGEEAEKVSAYR
jgi:hypothetical protein